MVAQKKSRADRFFEKGDFINAIEHYQKSIKLKPASKKQVQNLAIAYYNLHDFKNAKNYLLKSIKGKYTGTDKKVDPKFYFLLSHAYAALGNYEKGIDYLAKYNETQSDIASLDRKKAIREIESFKLKNPDFTTKKVFINSDKADFGAVQQGDTLYFVSDRKPSGVLGKKYKWTHRSFLDIYKVGIDKKGKPFGKPDFISGGLNTKLHDGNFCFSNDGKAIYFSKSNTIDGKKSFGDDRANQIHIYKSELINGQWSEPDKLSFNTEAASYEHPSISKDGSKLYFVSNREGGLGDYDIYYVTIDGEQYSEPINLGKTINTKHREQFPFVHENGDVFFSSNGHLGLGNLDVFVSENQNGTFLKAQNLGFPINSKYDDFSLTYTDAKSGYFASNRKNRNDDIIAFTQTGDIYNHPYPIQIEVRDKDSLTPIPLAHIEVSDLDSVYVAKVLDSTALHEMVLLASPYRYKVKATAEDYESGLKTFLVEEKKGQKIVVYLRRLPIPTPIDTTSNNELLAAVDSLKTKEPLANKKSNLLKDNQEELLTDIPDDVKDKLMNDEVGPPVIVKNGKLYFQLEPIYFDFDMWNIRADSQIILDALSAKLDRHLDIDLIIRSHTDQRGTARYNKVLSERRARSTRDYLALEGFINARRMEFEGFGEDQLIINCNEKQGGCSEEDHQLNRRSEFEIVSPEGIEDIEKNEVLKSQN